MKKMNRSQSSYRQCKTLIAEEEGDNLVSKYASKHFPARHPTNTSNSFIETNKENNSLFQSISERNFATKPREEISEFEVGRDDVKVGRDDVKGLQEKCRRYEEQLKKMYREKEMQYQSATNLNSSKSYNYTDQFYSNELEELRSQLAKKER
jgi:hypothetical protein